MADTKVDIKPWANDVIYRRTDADRLTKFLLNHYSSKPEEPGFVMAINAEWGLGKTYLLKNWAIELVESGHPAIYFDAWKNDFTPEPLIAFIAEIQKALEPTVSKVPATKRYLDVAVRKVQLLYKPAGKILLQALAKKLTGQTIDELQSLIDAADDNYDDDSTVENEEGTSEKKRDNAEIRKALKKISELALKEHQGKAEAIKAFNENIALLVAELQKVGTVKLPVFFFIDELDRCRPDYAIQLLEGIKHLFGVPGVYFVVATNMEQLAHSIQAIYGATFDGVRYLKRFFDIEYKLPDPDTQIYAKYLFERAALPSQNKFITGLNQHNYGSADKSPEVIFSYYSAFFNLGLRDQEHVVKIIEAASVGLATVHSHWLFFLAALYYRNVKIVEDIIRSEGSLSQSAFMHIINKIRTFPTAITTSSLKGDYTGSTRPISTDVLTIAFQYYGLAWKDLKQIQKDHLQINSAEFPECLTHAVMSEMPNHYAPGDSHPTSFVSYPQLVSQAGCFS